MFQIETIKRLKTSIKLGKMKQERKNTKNKVFQK